MAVVISGVTGTLNNGGTMTVNGSGFGPKAIAVPLVFDKLDDGTPPDNLVIVGCFSGNEIFNATLQKRPRRTFSARTDAKDSRNNFFRYDDHEADRWFLNYFIFLDEGNLWGPGGAEPPDVGKAGWGFSNLKIIRFFSLSSTYQNTGLAIHSMGSLPDGLWAPFMESLTGVNYSDQIAGPVPMTEAFEFGTWVQVQCEFIESSTVNAANAQLRVWVRNATMGGVRAINLSDKVSRNTTEPNLKRPFYIGFWDSFGPSETAAANAYLYYNDVVVDDSIARVELASSATYDTATYVEYQRATTWGATSIEISAVNLGALADSSTAYVFVTDNAGVRNATGFPITLGAGEGIPPTGGVSATDNFNRVDVGNIGGNWTVTKGSCRIRSNTACGGTAAFTNIAIWNATTFSADQYAQATVGLLDASGPFVGVVARAASGVETQYRLVTDSLTGAWELKRINAGVHTVLSLGPSGLLPGHIVRLEVEGTGATVTVRCYGGAAGTTLLTASSGTNPYLDTTASRLVSGQPGIWIYGDANNNSLDNWGGGDLGSGEPVPPDPSPATFFDTGLDMADIYRYATTVTKSDTVAPPAHRALWVTTSGNLVITTEAGDATLAVAAGQVIPIACKRVKVASTAVVVALQ